jgi:hypothetical protein
MGSYNPSMARPKKFAERTVMAFPERTFERIASHIEPNEDRTDFIRHAVQIELALRSADFYADLKRFLLADEDALDFCIDAIRRAVLQRKAAIQDSGVERAGATGFLQEQGVK